MAEDPEGRFETVDRTTIGGAGRREEARRLLLRTADSRFQEEVDRALETIESAR